MKRLLILTSLLALTLVASACQTTSEMAGQGPVKLSIKPALLAESFAENDLSGSRYTYMAVTADGQNAFYGNCETGITIRCSAPATFIIDSCNERYKTEDCQLFMDTSEIFWQNPGDFMPFYSEILLNKLGQTYYSENTKGKSEQEIKNDRFYSRMPTEENREKFDITFIGSNKIIPAYYIFGAPDLAWSFGFRTNQNEIRCLGHASYFESEWEYQCEDGSSGQGTGKEFATSDTLGMIAHGKNSKNEKLQFELLWK